MPTAHEQFSEQFRRWELRGRGWQVFDEPVHPEPPFVPFHGHHLSPEPIVDDGRRPTILSSLFRKLTAPRVEAPADIPEPEEEPEPQPLIRENLIELKTSVSNDFDVGREAFEQFFRNVALCREPIAFELLGTACQVTVQFVAGEHDAPLVRRQLQAYFPGANFQPEEGVLLEAWESCNGNEALVFEFGLGREFMLPLATGKLDPFIGLIGALAELSPTDLGLFQVIFQPVQEAWPESIVNSVTTADGKPFFVNSPELAGAADAKVSSPLYAAVVRIAAKGESFERALQIATDMAGSLKVFSHPQGNELIPLRNDDYPDDEHIEDVIFRQSRRPGMILNSDELIGFVHLPSSAVRTPALVRDTGKSKAAPAIVRLSGVSLGTNRHAGKTVEVKLSPEQRTRHMHIVGASGTGKSTLLYNLILQDIKKGNGIAVLDPHGDLVDRILGVIPPERIDDVVLVNPSDAEFPIGFNILQAHSDAEKSLLASDLVAVFQRLSTSWGDQMNSVFQNAILAFLESDRAGTIADLRRFLIEPAYRNEFLKSVRDSEIVYYWQKSFPHLSGNKSIGSILTRLDTFLAQKPIRHMVSQPENRLDFAHIMDTGKIFLAKLPEGLLGRENSYLLGSLLVSKFQQIAMSRQEQAVSSRRDFWLYIDEFANFITPSMAEILSAARKYRIGLTLAHHELHQLQRNPEVASAVMTHPYTRIVFRVGDDDARKLAESFSYFEANDLRNLETGQAICRVKRSDFDFNLSVPMPAAVDVTAVAARQQEVVTASRNKYGTPRADVETMLAKSRAAPDERSEKPTPILPQPPAIVEPSPPVPLVAATPQPSEPPQCAEIPKAVETPAEPMPAIGARSPEPRDLGRGGAQHKAVQKRIKEAAEKVGFRGIIEKSVSEGQGSVDLWLERADQSIACEISFSTTIDHEVGNVAKCLKTGVSKVAVICLNEERLRKISTAISGSLGSEGAARVLYYQPDQFIADLKALPPPVSQPTETQYAGYKVKRSAPKLSAAEQKQKEDIAHRAIAETMRRK